uniref:Photosystem I subunit X n=1 Tax=Tetraselmis sp. GSL018 TaxID=582737 RepID=A0A061R7L1_9CHLO|mmetsp:Transcript_8823/g.21314  ORF Transcript_8823/g.21314 Transcript_8823/m.21314 type:complete len:124 (+) Transcript_8823:88-459(+)|eukprot:CAMPEP_0177600240 /NCGR_PEP_ID=MMETSP0419_2-20121207/13498_1 /TAXON_ID=582737 /ORGANISM="Tetraselmis sp., Strain GSL018" /LENGTH=123 /DNA_ID=CAMNT_0019093181 /DNA_START=82 /DNA_END=453 /DNA_ORIENTATION=+
MASAVSTPIRSFTGLRAAPAVKPVRAVKVAPRVSRHALQTRADFIGSSNNLIMTVSTTLCLVAGRFGLAPTAAKRASAGLKLSPVENDMKSGDPSGFTAVDVLALGAVGHVIGAGIILGLKAL